MSTENTVTIILTIALGIASSMTVAAVSETWESSPLQAVFDGTADLQWAGDTAAYAVEEGSWPDGSNIFGNITTKAIRSTNASMTVAGQYTLVTDVTAEIDPSKLIEWSVYASGNSISIQVGYDFQMVLLANTSDDATIESPNAAFQGYRLTVSQRTVATVTSDWLTLWKCSGSDSAWVALDQVDLGSAWVNNGWNLHVSRSPAGAWVVSHATGTKGTTPAVDFTATDTSVALAGPTWHAGMTWITKGASHANKFGFDDFRVEASVPPNVPPTADAGVDQTVTDADTDGSEPVTLDGAGSADTDGTITSYVWSDDAGTIATGAAPQVALAVGIHDITLTVTDDDGAADADTVTITVMPGGPWPPIADAGPDQSVRDSDGNGSESITLDGAGSSDLGGSIVAWIWKEGDTPITAGETAVAALDVGVHTLTLEVVDNDSLTGTDTVQITVTAVGPTTDQISQHGITWTFSQPVEYGQFVNGDYWVIGPVTIASVDPAPADGKHGSMLNPSIGDGQAYDSVGNGYSAAAGVTFPVMLTGDNSLVSTRSWTDTAEIHQDLTGHNIAADVCNIRDGAVLTVLTDVPPADGFRPPYADTDKRIFRQSDLRYDLLPRLAPPDASPSYNYGDAGIFSRNASMTVAEQYGRIFQRPWLLHLTDWSGRGIHPTENMPGYHREVYNAISVSACLLLMDLPDIDNLLLGFVQLGIDSYGVIATGAGDNSSDADSGINKWPVLLAGLLLDDEAMKTNNYRYRTRWMTYYIVDGTSPYVSAIVPFGQTYNGYPVGWRQDPGTQEHEHLDPATEWILVSDGGGAKRESYRYINSHTWPGFTLAARLMGAVDLWNDAAFFDYVDRWMTEAPTQYGTPSVGGTSSAFVSDMWATYRNHTSLTAHAGPDQHLIDADANGIEMVLLDGTGSSQPSGTITAYLWAEGATYLGSNALQPIFLTVGPHTITLKVTDSFGSEATDTVEITIGPAAMPGDFDSDGVVNVHDIDLLAAAIRAPVPEARFDLTSDGMVDAADLDELIRGILGTEFGDSNLDGNVDLDDFVALKQSFGSPGAWGDGDFDASGQVDLDDFVTLKQNFGFPFDP